MRKFVMLFAVLLGTTMMVNANTINTKPKSSKEVKTIEIGKHRKHKKAASKTAEVVKPNATAKK